ncbi:outer membrane protein [Labrys sp. ZIDIC5]|uniref:outer membrane protein n=1 Tax=Labrys sedimenti TaxID=3106036 RepID=UPI002ACABBE7|nr:outer membrane beta-barrel protein [Labrys sp. ZIDIC5]MDZ5453499.1 outer membrane beta-barrel protein [Labrys sp. ZIDIC5]
MRLVLAVALAVLFPSAALAADLAPAPAEPAAPAAPGYSWTGFYAGLHAGYGWGEQNVDQNDLIARDRAIMMGGTPLVCPPGQTFLVMTGVCEITDDKFMPNKFDVKGVIGGVHAGYNYQFANSGLVVGVEGDVDYAGIKGHANGLAGVHATREDDPFGLGMTGFVQRSLHLKSEWQGSVRLRAGYAIDNILLYATGGIAIAEANLINNTGLFAQGGIPVSGLSARTSSSKVHIGWTAGLGAEYAITANWLLRAEVRYTAFQEKSYGTSYIANANTLIDKPVKIGWDQVTSTLGLSYKF